MSSQMSMESNSGPGVIAGWWALGRRRWPVGLAIFLVVLGLALSVLVLARPVYRAEARLRLGEPPPMGGVSPGSGLLGLWRLGGDAFANDLELFRSRSLAESVVEDAGLHVRVRAPRGFSRDSLFVGFAAGRGTERASFDAEWTGDGRVRVSRTAPSDSAIGTVAPGESIEFGGVTVAFRPWRRGMPRQIGISTVPFAEAVRLTRPQLRVERVRREANVLDLGFDHTDAGVSEAAVRSTVNRFIALRATIQRRESGQTVDSLRLVTDRTADELRAAETALEEFQRRTRLVSPEIQGEAFVGRYSEAVAALARTRFELEAIRSLLRRVNDIADPAQAWTEVVAHPRFLENETMGGLLARLMELEAERKAIAERRTEANPEHRVILDQMAELDRMLRSLAISYEVGLREQADRFAAQVGEMDAELAGLPPQAIELGRLQRSVRLLSEVLVLTEQRVRQEELRDALTFANVQVVDPPALRDRPVWPRKKRGLAVGLLLASAFAVLGMVVVERADRTVRSAADVRAALGATVLAAVARPRDGSPVFASHEVWAVLRHGAQEDGGPLKLIVAPADKRVPAGEVARALITAAGNGREAEARPVPPLVTPVVPVETYASAAEAAAEGVPVALVAFCGRTRADDLRRAAGLLQDAGGRLAGVILLAARQRDVDDVWQ